jgi:hypothetical protein
MEQEYKLALRIALREKRLWAAGFICALFFAEAWWIIFDWDPQYLGERVGGWARGTGVEGLAEDLLFITVALAAFVVFRALAYLGEMVLVRQVAEHKTGEVPRFLSALATSRGRYFPLALTLLPWDAMRVGVVYLPAVILLAWNRWDPHYNLIILYLLVLLLWFSLLLAVYLVAGMVATLAARFCILEERGVPEVWLEGWKLLRSRPTDCFAVWLQALAADLLFLIFAWPLSALLPWVVGLFAVDIGSAPLRWLIYVAVYGFLAAVLICAQTYVQCFRSALWTVFFLGLREKEGFSEAKEEKEEPLLVPLPEWFPEPPSDFIPPPARG